MNNEIIKFAIEDVQRFIDDDDVEMGLAKVMFLSTRPNSHELIITEDVLRQYANTILGKWVIAEYNEYNEDVTTHTNNQQIIGMVMKDQEVEFVRAEDGYLDAYVDCVISKLYATKVYDLFLKQNGRSVSVEMVTDAEEGKGKVNQFNIMAVTVLGLSFNPSVPKANIKMIRFSEEEANNFYKKINTDKFDLRKFAEDRKKEFNSDKVKEEVKKEEMEKDIKKDTPLEEKGKPESENKDKETKEKEKVSKKMAEEPKDENKENPEKQEKMGCDDDYEDKDNVETMESLKTKLEEKEKIIMGYESELAELKKFKEDAMNEKKMAVVNSTLAKVKDKIEETKFAKFSDESKNYSYENIDAWKNAVLASVTESFLKLSDENPEIMKFEILKDPKKETESLWDRL